MKSIFPYLVFIFLLVQFVRAMLAAQKQSAAHEEEHDETDEQRRMREVQERIRRKIAERRGEGHAPAAPEPAPLATDQPRPRPTVMAPPPVAGGPLETLGGEILRKVLEQPAARTAPPPMAGAHAAEQAAILARQQELAEQMRELEAARQAAQRRAAGLAAEQAAAAQAAAATKAREGWLGELRDAKNLKRAIVLREVLGTPVGLR